MEDWRLALEAGRLLGCSGSLLAKQKKKLRQKLSRLKFVYPFFRFAQAAKEEIPAPFSTPSGRSSSLCV